MRISQKPHNLGKIARRAGERLVLEGLGVSIRSSTEADSSGFFIVGFVSLSAWFYYSWFICPQYYYLWASMPLRILDDRVSLCANASLGRDKLAGGSLE